jgi:hypothetical protein
MTLMLEPPPTIETATPEPWSGAIELAVAAHTIRCVAADPFFVGHTLALCTDRFGIDVETLAGFLGCPPAGLARLAVSRQPDPTAPGYCADLRRIAAGAGADPAMLAALLELTEPIATGGGTAISLN